MRLHPLIYFLKITCVIKLRARSARRRPLGDVDVISAQRCGTFLHRTDVTVAPIIHLEILKNLKDRNRGIDDCEDDYLLLFV